MRVSAAVDSNTYLCMYLHTYAYIYIYILHIYILDRPTFESVSGGRLKAFQRREEHSAKEGWARISWNTVDLLPSLNVGVIHFECAGDLVPVVLQVLYIRVYIYLNMCTWIHMYTYIHIHRYVYIFIHKCIYVCVCVCVRVCACVCVRVCDKRERERERKRECVRVCGFHAKQKRKSTQRRQTNRPQGYSCAANNARQQSSSSIGRSQDLQMWLSCPAYIIMHVLHGKSVGVRQNEISKRREFQKKRLRKGGVNCSWRDKAGEAYCWLYRQRIFLLYLSKMEGFRPLCPSSVEFIQSTRK